MSIHKIDLKDGVRWEVRWRDPMDTDIGKDVHRSQRFRRRSDAVAFDRKVKDIKAAWREGEAPYPDGIDLEHPRSADGIITALSDLLELLHPGYRFTLHWSDNDPDGRQLPLAGSISWYGQTREEQLTELNTLRTANDAAEASS